MAQIYDPRFHTWDSWASLMIEAYADQQLPTPGAEKDWRSWAVALNGLNIFISQGVSDPDNFGTWQNWAEDMIETLGATT